MRKVVAGVFVTLDGIMQAPGGPDEDPTGGFRHGGWTAAYWHESMGEVIDGMMAAPFDLLLGRRTYEIFAAHWPHAGDDPIARKFNAAVKYVATSSPEALGWRNSVALQGDVAAEIARLKREDGPNLLVQGSSVLFRTLFAHDLVDELSLFVVPIVLGAGKRLFGPGASPAAFRLTGSRTAPTGVVMSSYVRSGEVATGSFAMDPPTEAEVARRQRILQEG